MNWNLEKRNSDRGGHAVQKTEIGLRLGKREACALGQEGN